MRTRAVYYPQGGAWWVERWEDGHWRPIDGHIWSRWLALFKAWRWSFRSTSAVEFYKGAKLNTKPYFYDWKPE